MRQFAERVVAWSPDGRTFAIGSGDWSIRIVDAETGRITQALRSHTDMVTGLVWSADGKFLASTSSDKSVKVHTITERGRERSLSEIGQVLWCVAWSPDGRRVATGGEGNECRICNVSTGQDDVTFGGIKGLVRSVGWNAGGTQVAVAAYDHTVRVFGASSGEERLRLDGITAWPSAAVWSPDDTQLAVGDWDGVIKFYYATTGRLLRTIQAHSKRIDSVAWSPDGRYLASAGGDSEVRVWHVGSGRRAANLPGHSGEVTHVAWSRDGVRLASCALDGKIKIWDVADEREIATLSGHSAGVFQVAWHPDQRRIVSASTDQTWKLWDLETGQDTLTMRPEIGPLFAIAWSPDGRQIAAAGAGGSVRVWDASLGYEELEDALPPPPANPEKAARLLVESLFDELYLRDAVVARLHEDANLSEPVRAAAFALATSHYDNLLLLNNENWPVVRWPGRTREDYARALPAAERLFHHPETRAEFLNTAGVAFYRAGRDADAIAALERSSQLLASTADGDHPSNSAFRAMAKQRQGRTTEALAALEQARALMRNPKWAADRECRDFLREAEWQLTAEAVPWTALDLVEAKSLQGATLRELDDHSLLAGGANPANDTYRVVARTDLKRITAVRLEVLSHDELPRRGPGRNPNGNFVLSGVEIGQLSSDSVERRVVLRAALTEYVSIGSDVRFAAGLLPGPGWEIWQQDAPAPTSSAAFIFTEPIVAERGITLAVTLRHDSRFPQHNIGRFKLSATDRELPNLTATIELREKTE